MSLRRGDRAFGSLCVIRCLQFEIGPATYKALRPMATKVSVVFLFVDPRLPNGTLLADFARPLGAEASGVRFPKAHNLPYNRAGSQDPDDFLVLPHFGPAVTCG